jgi:hypothetical protein
MRGKVDVGGHWIAEEIGICVQRIVGSLGDVRHL